MQSAVRRAQAAAAAGRGTSSAAAAPAPSQPPPGSNSVQVTRERVGAPPERFIAVPDDSLLQHFQEALGSGSSDAADALPQLFSMLEGVSSHKFLALRRRLEGSFSIFSGACSGGAGGSGAAAAAGARRPLKHLSSIEAHGE